MKVSAHLKPQQFAPCGYQSFSCVSIPVSILPCLHSNVIFSSDVSAKLGWRFVSILSKNRQLPLTSKWMNNAVVIQRGHDLERQQSGDISRSSSPPSRDSKLYHWLILLSIKIFHIGCFWILSKKNWNALWINRNFIYFIKVRWFWRDSIFYLSLKLCVLKVFSFGNIRKTILLQNVKIARRWAVNIHNTCSGLIIVTWTSVPT